MSSGQSLRNGSSVEPGLPNTRLMPNARKRPKVASLTVSAALAVLADLRDDIGRRLPSGFLCSAIALGRRRKQSTSRWIALRSQAGLRKQIRRRHAPPPFFKRTRDRARSLQDAWLFLDAGIGSLPGAFVEAGKYRVIHLFALDQI